MNRKDPTPAAEPAGILAIDVPPPDDTLRSSDCEHMEAFRVSFAVPCRWRQVVARIHLNAIGMSVRPRLSASPGCRPVRRETKPNSGCTIPTGAAGVRRIV